MRRGCGGGGREGVCVYVCVMKGRGRKGKRRMFVNICHNKPLPSFTLLFPNLYHYNYFTNLTTTSTSFFPPLLEPLISMRRLYGK